MAPWTLQERMTLHVLFGHHKLNFYGRDWWALHHDITKTWRTERTCREDYKYSHGKERTKMYPDRILKRYSQYDAEERAAYDKAFQDVIDSARRQGITLPNGAGAQDEDEEIDEDEEVGNEEVENNGEESEEEESEESEDEEEDNGNEKNENEEDVEMEDAAEEFATSSEGGSDVDDAAGNDAIAHEDEAARGFRFPDFPDELAEAEFLSTGNAREILNNAIRARETSSKKPKVPATPARDTRALTALPKTVAKSKPAIAAGLSSANPIAVADSPAKTPVSLATSSGEPQKYGRTRSGSKRWRSRTRLRLRLRLRSADTAA